MTSTNEQAGQTTGKCRNYLSATCGDILSAMADANDYQLDY